MDNLANSRFPGTIGDGYAEQSHFGDSVPSEAIDGSRDSRASNNSTSAMHAHQSGLFVIFQRMSFNNGCSALSLSHQYLHTSRLFWSIVVWINVLVVAMAAVVCASLGYMFGYLPAFYLEWVGFAPLYYGNMLLVTISWLACVSMWMLICTPFSKLSM